MMRRFPTKLARDEAGSTLVEFAILAPVIFGMIFGVIQVGASMQSYNAMRSIASDTARYAAVEYMKKNEVSDAALQSYAQNLAASPPYALRGTQPVIMVESVATPRVDGTFEKTLTITYTPPNLMPIMAIPMPELNYSRPIFVIDE
ncbi:TadE/TadG family type IV pilus assembly protein [Erythrobacter mangrovi]|uniref:Pilus assembly protein n=1 Tax=Erythrobacter mangrovi TaxID=2739433 RepID=A0A7D3XC62_9SPHN|nr:TadE/TadG family type IV pilus assembly protein [Erythrobacter mangrovi]QKG71620.1 pilus assembly protein [Erythrobacter mangrovi]